MAVVLSSSEENSHFSSANLRRSYSQPTFVTAAKHPPYSPPPSNPPGRTDFFRQPSGPLETSSPSSATSSPRTVHVESTDPSCSSTPSSNFSLQPSDECDDDRFLSSNAQSDEQIILPHYDHAGLLNQLEDLEPAPSPQTGNSYAPTPSENTSRPESPILFERAEDDIAVRAQPSRHVDYLSHNWREEDIWSSWKLIVSRRGDYKNSARLENASWRTWMKSKNNLGTVSPETLNWLKDCDVTWLYGPLQPCRASLHHRQAEPHGVKLTSPASLIKKPILKKRSMSELMLQRSLSTSSLVKQAAAAVQAQQKERGIDVVRRPGLERSVTDSLAFPPLSRDTSQDSTLLVPSTASSGVMSPNGERKHIHFNERVDQCIAVEIKGADDDDVMDVDTDPFADDDSSDSDDGAIMMKRTATKKRPPVPKKKAKSSSSNINGESKTIAMLPSTTLKYRDETSESSETAMRHGAPVYRSPVISPSSSQETLRPSRPSGKLFFTGDDDEEEDGDGAADDDDEDLDYDGQPLHWRTAARSGEGSSSGGLHRSPSSAGSVGAEPAGMRRTASGMLMPYEEGESSTHEGVFGRVIDTVNTARDIAHVIWNVGWRR